MSTSFLAAMNTRADDVELTEDDIKDIEQFKKKKMTKKSKAAMETRAEDAVEVENTLARESDEENGEDDEDEDEDDEDEVGSARTDECMYDDEDDSDDDSDDLSDDCEECGCGKGDRKNPETGCGTVTMCDCCDRVVCSMDGCRAVYRPDIDFIEDAPSVYVEDICAFCWEKYNAIAYPDGEPDGEYENLIEPVIDEHNRRREGFRERLQMKHAFKKWAPNVQMLEAAAE
tara:strand:- start:264 stop:953 length:690 start_codon:yes stop_codon:yes gene_type:complete